MGERLMDVLDNAEAVLAGTLDGPRTFFEHPCVHVIRHINTLTANNIYEVLLALPFSQAHRLLVHVSRYFKAIAELPSCGAQLGGAAQTRALSAMATIETPCLAALITAYVHHKE